jgi:hypothetical protein
MLPPIKQTAMQIETGFLDFHFLKPQYITASVRHLQALRQPSCYRSHTAWCMTHKVKQRYCTLCFSFFKPQCHATRQASKHRWPIMCARCPPMLTSCLTYCLPACLGQAQPVELFSSDERLPLYTPVTVTGVWDEAKSVFIGV